MVEDHPHRCRLGGHDTQVAITMLLVRYITTPSQTKTAGLLRSNLDVTKPARGMTSWDHLRVITGADRLRRWGVPDVRQGAVPTTDE